MAIYAIGDVQGCYEELLRLLEKISFDPTVDRLWFCGDLVSRGPDSLKTLQFVRSLGKSAITVLGNHDLHLLALAHGIHRRNVDTLQPILDSPDRDKLLSWLQQRPLLHYSKKHRAVLVHAGLYPGWSLKQARALAAEVEQALRGEQVKRYLTKMYGNGPTQWSNELTGMKRLRCITNIMTRMRFFDSGGKLDFAANGSPRQHAGKGLVPWFQMESKLAPDLRVYFGHWSTLQVGHYGRCFALDGGCVWGGHLVALRIDNDTEDWFFVDSHTQKPINTAT